ncbi:serine/threonine protein kinase [Pirellulaceae bacterium SH449]
MTEKRCPPAEQIKAYLAGLLEPEGYDALSQHLLDCQDCEQTIISLEAEPDTLVEILKQPHAANLPEIHLSASLPQPQPQSPEDSASAHPRNGLPKQLGQYELLSLLGSGGMGAVYLARHQSLDKQVALKLLPALPSQNAEFVARFQREMRAAGKLDAPAIVRTTDAGQQDGIHYMVMDVIDGLNLSHIAKAEGKLAIGDACELIKQAAIGLAHAHEKGIVHRDVKPSNLMLDGQGQVRILDFGLAQMSFWESGTAEITTVGQLMGTLDYMAPEQAELGGAVDYRADLYSLGATLFRLLTGRAPLAAAPNLTPLEKLRLLATHKPPRLRSLRPDAPNELGDIVDGMLSREPSQRPASAIHAAELLEPYTVDADLVSLLQRAKDNPIQEDSAFAWSPLWHQDHSGNPSSPQSETKAGRSRFGGWGKWIAAACFGGLVFGGILFILETSRGQLVIDSEANVQVRLVSVDDSGSKTDIDDLQIMPGTKATRLRSGKYEIILEGASDSFVVHNGSFSIRNGEVVVATVTKKDSAAAGDKPTVEAVPPSPSDPRLDGIVYEGKSLRKLLETIRYERSISELEKAISAFDGIADPSVDDLVSPPMTDLMLREPTLFSYSAYMLYRCNPDRFVERLADALDSNPEIVETSDILRSLPTAIYFPRSMVKQPFERLYPYLERSIQSTDPYQRLSVAFQLRDLVYDSGQNIVPKEFQAKILSILSNSEGLNNESFWFRVANPLGETFSSPTPFGELLVSEVTQRALATLSASEFSKEEVALALLILRKMIEDGHSLSAEQTLTLADSITPLLRISTQTLPVVDVYSFPNNCLLPKWIEGVLSASDIVAHTKLDGQKQRNVRVDHTILTLNLIDSAKMQEQMKPQLTRLMEELNATRLFDPRLGSKVKQRAGMRWEMIAADNPDENQLLQLRQLVYGQVATMLGQDKTEIFARFETKQKVDLDYEIQKCVERFRFGDSGWLDELKSLYEKNSDLQISELLEEILIKNGNRAYLESGPGYSHIEFLAKVTGNQFPASLARVANELNSDAREVLFDTFNYSISTEFRWDDPASMEVLLKWSDEQLIHRDDILSTPELRALTDMLFSIVLAKPHVTPECQQMVLDRLETYRGLTVEKFWLLAAANEDFFRIKPNTSGRIFKNNIPMRLAILRKAVSLLAAEGMSESLRCHAWAVISNYAEYTKQLSPKDREELSQLILSTLTRASNNPDDCFRLVPIDEAFRRFSQAYFGPAKTGTASLRPMGRAVQDLKQGDTSNLLVDAYANELMLVLAFLLRQTSDEDYSLSKEFNELILSLHEFCDHRGMDVNHGATWVANEQSRRRNDAFFFNNDEETNRAVISHLVYVQTGVLLGKNFDELVNRPTVLYQQEMQRKARFIQPGDTLSIHYRRASRGTVQPPVIQAGTRTPVVGFPYVVDREGMIDVQDIGKIDTTDCDLDMLKTKIEEKIRELKGTAFEVSLVSLSFLLRHYEPLELRNVTGGQTNAKQ